MSITFHCTYCGRKVEAPDSAGGKWGKCPACHNKLYVPGLAPDQELKLAPVDTADLEKQKQLSAETRRVEQDILSETEEPAESATPVGTSVSKISDEQLKAEIIAYLRQTADGELDQAQKTADSIAPYSAQALKILDTIALSEIPEPALSNLPPQVLSSLIRTLRSRIT